MDFEKNRRRQNLKVIISEAFMVLAVIATVSVLAFIVSGYWLNSDFEVKRQGLLQVSSIPTGADIDIDGDSSWLQKTNTSKVLTSGEHTITLTKEGYDSWTKTISIKEGLLYRLHYPRLFLKERTTEKVLTTTGTTYATTSPDHSSIILINGTTEWSYINLNDEQITPKSINIGTIFSDVSIAPEAKTGIFTGKILDVDWDANGMHALFKIQSENGLEWVLLNPKEIKNSINLTREFGVNFSNIKIFDSDANTLLAIQNGNLHKIDVSGRSVSAVLLENVISFDYYNNEIFFSASDNNSAEDTNAYYLGVMKIGDKVKELENRSSPAKVAMTKFYEDKFLLTLDENKVVLYNKEDFTPTSTFELSFNPESLKIGHEGEYIIMYNDTSIATLDMESMAIKEWNVEGNSFGWLDNDMIYTVKEGELIVYDFDGLNRRVLAKNVSNHFPVAITDNRYLYYFSDDSLIREWLIPR